MSVIAVIPARYGSTRFAGKPLATISGLPMIQRVYENARGCSLVDRVIVATDSDVIAAVVKKFGGEVCMTAATHQTGTDRIAEAMRHYDSGLIVNMQGDEPLLPPNAISEALQPMLEDQSIPMGTLKTCIRDRDDITNTNVVKVVTNEQGFALYFSRLPIPCNPGNDPSVRLFRHVGLYVYTRKFLMTFAGLRQTMLERTERLEQLRALEHGYPIRVVETEYYPVGVDVPEDIQRVERILSATGSAAACGMQPDSCGVCKQ
jgi:3-deoxy-manno-octulosonate cytidylyltransferase (CMP-KDO synthetase)